MMPIMNLKTKFRKCFPSVLIIIKRLMNIINTTEQMYTTDNISFYLLHARNITAITLTMKHMISIMIFLEVGRKKQSPSLRIYRN